MIIKFVKITLLDSCFFTIWYQLDQKIKILNLEMDHLGSVDFLIEILVFQRKI